MIAPYIVRQRHRDWCVEKRTVTGNRQMASGMSERTARLVARLLNEHEAQK